MPKENSKSDIPSAAFNVLKIIGSRLADALKHKPGMAAIVLIIVVVAVVLLAAVARLQSPERLVMVFLFLSAIAMVLCFALDRRSRRELSAQQQAVVAALERPEFDWRTALELSKETEIPIAAVRRILAELSDLIISSPIPDKPGERRYTTKNAHLLRQSAVDRALSVLSDRVR